MMFFKRIMVRCEEGEGRGRGRGNEAADRAGLRLVYFIDVYY